MASEQHRTKLHYHLFSDAYSASCSCGWCVSSCTDRERIVRLKTEHEREHKCGVGPAMTAGNASPRGRRLYRWLVWLNHPLTAPLPWEKP